MGLLMWVLFGTMLGWIVSILNGTNRDWQAIILIAIGIFGSLLGGSITEILSNGSLSRLDLSSLLFATVGALAMIFGYKTILNK